jgi:serine/threonine protein kinase
MSVGPVDLEIGSTLGNYRIDSLLGRGGMGVVYVGEHAILGRKAAIKVLLPEVLAINGQIGVPKHTLNVDFNGGLAIRL